MFTDQANSVSKLTESEQLSPLVGWILLRSIENEFQIGWNIVIFFICYKISQLDSTYKYLRCCIGSHQCIILKCLDYFYLLQICLKFLYTKIWRWWILSKNSTCQKRCTYPFWLHKQIIISLNFLFCFCDL